MSSRCGGRFPPGLGQGPQTAYGQLIAVIAAGSPAQSLLLQDPKAAWVAHAQTGAAV